MTSQMALRVIRSLGQGHSDLIWGQLIIRVNNVPTHSRSSGCFIKPDNFRFYFYIFNNIKTMCMAVHIWRLRSCINHRFGGAQTHDPRFHSRCTAIDGRPVMLFVIMVYLSCMISNNWDNIYKCFNILFFIHTNVLFILSRAMDFITIMTYDLHGSWEDVTGHNSPLFPHSGETGNERFLNMVSWGLLGRDRQRTLS